MNKTPSLLKIQKTSWAWWRVPVIPATQEAEAGKLPEPRRRRLQWAEIAPLHSSLGNKSETPSQKTKECFKTVLYNLARNAQMWSIVIPKCIVFLECEGFANSSGNLISFIVLHIRFPTPHSKFEARLQDGKGTEIRWGYLVRYDIFLQGGSLCCKSGSKLIWFWGPSFRENNICLSLKVDTDLGDV